MNFSTFPFDQNSYPISNSQELFPAMNCRCSIFLNPVCKFGTHVLTVSFCFRLVLSYKDVCKQARVSTDGDLRRLALELETVGNVRFEEGSNDNMW